MLNKHNFPTEYSICSKTDVFNFLSHINDTSGFFSKEKNYIAHGQDTAQKTPAKDEIFPFCILPALNNIPSVPRITHDLVQKAPPASGPFHNRPKRDGSRK